jgi:hypothetical protein
MFYKNKKTIRKIETPLCSDNLKKKLNKSQISQKEDLFDEINSNVNDENIIKPRERRASTNVTNSAFSYQYLLNNNNNKVNINDDDNQYNNTNMNFNNDNKIELINLTNEKINLNNNNIKLLQLLNENNQKNIELKDYIEEYRKKGLLTKAKFLRHLEKLKHRSKEIKFDSEIINKKRINTNNINEIKKENEYLIKKIQIKDNDFQNLYDFMMEIISFSQPYIKEYQDNVNELSLFKNNKLKEVETSFDNNISKEIITIKNDYENLKIKYNKLVEKMKNENDKEESQKQKVKFVIKDVAEKSIKEYENKIIKLKEENNKLIYNYKLQIEKLKNNLLSLQLKNENKEKEFILLNDKYEKIIQSLKDKLKNEKVSPNEDFNF